jgi:hypothetical protein
VGRRVPFEEGGVVDVVLDEVVLGVGDEGSDGRDLLEGGDRGAEDVEQAEGELPVLRGVEEADVAKRAERRAEAAGPDVDDADLGPESCRVSMIFIWSVVWVRSTTSVMSGWKRLRVPRGCSVSKARAGVPREAM